MLKPSYAELMDILNKDSEENVTSRYTVVIAAAKRARQLIDGDEPMVEEAIDGKPLSTAVEEIREGKIKVVPEGQGTVLENYKDLGKEIKEELAAESSDEPEKPEEVKSDEAVSEEAEEIKE